MFFGRAWQQSISRKNVPLFLSERKDLYMHFRPCIDIHNGQVKQIVGGSLTDQGNQAKENFTASKDADFYAKLYQKDGLRGGHVILLNPESSEYYGKTKAQAMLALRTYPGGLQVGGGIHAENAREFLEAGASHVIVTSYVFRDGKINWENMQKLKEAVGKEKVVIDLSCRKKDDGYYIVTDRWQKFTNVKLTQEVLSDIAKYCDEYLVHGVDVEGKAAGIDEELAELLGTVDEIPVTYAGGIASLEDIEHFRQKTGGRVDFTIGSALDLFGGHLSYEQVKKI